MECIRIHCKIDVSYSSWSQKRSHNNKNEESLGLSLWKLVDNKPVCHYSAHWGDHQAFPDSDCQIQQGTEQYPGNWLSERAGALEGDLYFQLCTIYLLS